MKNLLPYDGKAYYFGSIMDEVQSGNFFREFMNQTPWIPDQIKMYGRWIQTKRKVAWYGEEGLNYTYAHSLKIPLPWTDVLLELKAIVSQKTRSPYNSCLLNLYHNHTEGMGWHQDNEPELQKGGSIASLSLGAVRNFQFRHKSSKIMIEQMLEDGSLIEMKDEIQDHWQHSLPKARIPCGPRINLTFRTIANAQVTN